MNNRTAAIVIPVYRNDFKGSEKASIARCFSLWGDRYDIYFVKPVTLSLGSLLKDYPAAKSFSFDPSFFRGKKGYNKLMLSPLFYEKFLDYTYIFIYQTDGYVFRDELEEWCGKEYDYIGAPWIPKRRNIRTWYKIYVKIRSIYFRSLSLPDRSIQYFNVGNGGVSLRRSKIFHKITREDRDKIVSFIRRLGRSSLYNEDVYWSLEAKTSTGVKLNKPDYRKALEFCFDMNPDVSYELNNNRLPFCCHGISNPGHWKFWKQFINLNGEEKE